MLATDDVEFLENKPVQFKCDCSKEKFASAIITLGAEQIQELIDQEKIDYERQQQELKELYASGKDENLNSEAAYNDAMEQLTIMHLERMLSLAGLNAEQRKQVEKQLLDYKVKCIQKDQKANEQNSKTNLKQTSRNLKKDSVSINNMEKNLVML